ncbi:flagellar hook-associated protein FlgK [Aeoliella sp. ICT_H6.2]|uniref:Flagellar hook-associated protein 1 n=1 Tax=Aeoliella straminimaris TaxID=2954799 RepID=A0A9X2F8T1_9BACT|nr:flagellar hook-associated protein FlgK [Aeoliella straminimaris]MCO6043773.1 flagellar hook-associated protein FlgK [Aeoliella straminimaris]
MASNTLQAMQVGLHVVGNNIANANTPGYIREEVVYAPAPVQKKGDLVLGLGVVVEGIVQKVDKFLQERLRNSASDRSNAEVQEKAYADLEQILGELSDTDLSSSFSSFFGAIDEVLNVPDDLSNRNLAVLAGKNLVRDFNRFSTRTEDLHERLDIRVNEIAGEINELSEEIRKLNLQITEVEGGGLSGSDAGGLRVQRDNAVAALAELADVRVVEQPTGALTVTVGGEYIVTDGIRREVFADDSTTAGRNTSIIRFHDTNAELDVSAGEIRGLYAARDEITGGVLSDLDELAATLAFEFNKIYSQGQGVEGFSRVSSVDTVIDSAAALDEAGLAFTPVNGAFDILIRNTNTDKVVTQTIRVDLNGLDDDTSLEDLAAEISSVSGLTASITSTGGLNIATDAANTEFAFSGDTSGVLAALGINTFFTGSTAATLGVNQQLEGIDNAGLFAASLGGIKEDARNAERMVEFFTQSLDSLGGASLSDKYSQLANGIAQGSAAAKSVAEGFRTFETTLEGESQALSAVNIDEEAVKMISLQRSYQASAKYIQTISQLLDMLVNL